MKKEKISILDYGIGNLDSLSKFFKRLGYRATITNKVNDLENTNLLILPGVGAYPVAMKNLNDLELIDFLKSYIYRNKPLIGICLGMQLLAEQSTEFGHTKGLGVIPGYVDSIKFSKWHIGWNSISVKKDHPHITSNNKELYFNHSYEFNCEEEFIIAKTFIDNKSRGINAVIQKGKVFGLQFHPEKSQEAGMNFMKSLVLHLLN